MFYFILNIIFFTFLTSVRSEWVRYRKTKTISGTGINITPNLLEMATEENGVDKYPTPSDMIYPYDNINLDEQKDWTKTKNNRKNQ